MQVYFFRLSTGDNIFGQMERLAPNIGRYVIDNPMILETLDDGNAQYMMMVRYGPGIQNHRIRVYEAHVVHYERVSPLMVEYYNFALEQCEKNVDKKFEEGIRAAVDQIKKMIEIRASGPSEPASESETTEAETFKERVRLSQLAKLTDTKN